MKHASIRRASRGVGPSAREGLTRAAPPVPTRRASRMRAVAPQPLRCAGVPARAAASTARRAALRAPAPRHAAHAHVPRRVGAAADDAVSVTEARPSRARFLACMQPPCPPVPCADAAIPRLLFPTAAASPGAEERGRGVQEARRGERRRRCRAVAAPACRGRPATAGELVLDAQLGLRAPQGRRQRRGAPSKPDLNRGKDTAEAHPTRFRSSSALAPSARRTCTASPTSRPQPPSSACRRAPRNSGDAILLLASAS